MCPHRKEVIVEDVTATVNGAQFVTETYIISKDKDGNVVATDQTGTILLAPKIKMALWL